MNYPIYNKTGKILRVVTCSKAMSKIQAKEDEFIMEGAANDSTQKVEFDGFNEKGRPINPRIVDKPPEEIEAEKPSEPSKLIKRIKQSAYITKEQWEDVLKRLDDLEKQ